MQCSAYNRVRQNFSSISFASNLGHILNNFDHHNVAKFVAGCLAARDSILAKA